MKYVGVGLLLLVVIELFYSLKAGSIVWPMSEKRCDRQERPAMYWTLMGLWLAFGVAILSKMAA